MVKLNCTPLALVEATTILYLIKKFNVSAVLENKVYDDDDEASDYQNGNRMYYFSNNRQYHVCT